MKDIYKILVFAAIGFWLIWYFEITKPEFLIMYDNTLQAIKSLF